MTARDVEAFLLAICHQNKLTYLDCELLEGTAHWTARGILDKTFSGRSLPHVLDQIHAARQARDMAADLNLRAD